MRNLDYVNNGFHISTKLLNLKGFSLHFYTWCMYLKPLHTLLILHKTSHEIFLAEVQSFEFN